MELGACIGYFGYSHTHTYIHKLDIVEKERERKTIIMSKYYFEMDTISPSIDGQSD